MMTQQEAYESLSPFIQDFIYQQKWEALSPLQIASIEAIKEGSHNLLLTAGTASGKTEAAFLPCITQIEELDQTIGILYISPLKALINDQFVRIEELLKNSALSITKWHGDTSSSRKMNLLNHVNGILQTTPESLEAMFCLHPERIDSLFANLKYIIIDEIHYFIGDPRGIQLRILLERLEKRTSCRPIHIGLSATISNTKEALQYLKFGSDRPGKTISAHNFGTQTFCSLTATRIGKEEFPERFVRKLYRQVKDKRTLLFTNSRKDCELTIYHLKEYARQAGEDDIFHVHHGSITREGREETEKLMKLSKGPICTSSTMTLELGIDIGSLDEVVQTVAPISITGMVQRLGRSGRRSGRSSISFQLKHHEDHGDPSQLDLGLIRTIAMIELYFRERYMEAISMTKAPYGLLAHTVLSILCEKGCLQAQYLAYHTLQLSTFSQVSQEDFRDLLHHMMDRDYLTLYEDGALGLSDQGERLVNSQDFYSVFSAEHHTKVYCDPESIATINYSSHYHGDYFYRVDQGIMDKIHEVLASEDTYRYMDETTTNILKDIREKWKKFHLDQEESVESKTGDLILCPSLSTAALNGLYHVLRAHDISCKEFYLRDFLYGIKIRKDQISKFKELCRSLPQEKHLIDYGYVVSKIKDYNPFSVMLPDHLLAKEIIERDLDLDAVRKYLCKK